uniref:dynein assembly factor 3, axonemal-like n=1 Tax=Styela clava TaxID=7725 RepID=UPI0019397190|nr:dynein assembly factor 3, axonemal-like [Styela clava]
MSSGGEGFGSITWWGFTSSLDLQAEVDENNHGMEMSKGASKNEHESLNILIVGAGDCRHIIKTIAQRKRHKHRKIHFYVIENNPELLARHLLLITLAVEPTHKMGLQEKTELFAEIYGNTLIRQQTYQYVQDKANLFIEMISDLDYADERMPIVDMSQLKFRERDFIEGIFKFWREPDPRYFNITTMWDARLRHYLGVRYDSRSGAYDWDLSMKLHDLGAKVISKMEYVRWREKGIAFEAREGVYDRPNKTLSSGLVLKRNDGSRVPTRGYWGDMVTGPFITFGVESEEQSLFKTANGAHVKNSEDITLHNLLCLFHELQSGERYQIPAQQETEDANKIIEMDEDPNAMATDVAMETTETNHDSSHHDIHHEDHKHESHVHHQHKNKEFYAPIQCDDVCVHFLSLNCLAELHKKSKFQKLFNVVFMSTSMVQQFTPVLRPMFADECVLIIELAKFILDVNKEQVAGFAKRVTEMARDVGFEPKQVPSPKDSFAKFAFRNI